jgi:hypothetical protein
MKKTLFSTGRRITAAFLILILLSFINGCMFYYKVQTVDTVTPQAIQKFDSLNKYLILHQGSSAWHLSNPGITDNMLSGDLLVLPENRWKFLTTDKKGGNRYINSGKYNESYVLDEVHLYVMDSIVPSLLTYDNIRIAFSTIKKAEIYLKAKGRTNASWLIPMFGVPAVAIGLTFGIIALTKSSCPLIYIKRGNDYTFAGEIFGGAVYASLERHDYMPLPGFKPLKNRYVLKIVNGLPEVQYINLAELWIVNHTGNISVLPDRQGIVHTFSKPESPVAALSLANSNLLPLVKTKDQRCFLFDEDPLKTGDTCAFNTVFLTFPVPEKPDYGKFIITAGNSIWGDYTYGEFTKLFGNKYGEWIKKQGKEPAEKNSRWKLDQRFALMIYLETETGWQFVDYFDLIGPLGARDLVMPLDLGRALIKNTPDQGTTIRIKLESGFKFWDLDYAAMDFSKDKDFTIDRVTPITAITESGKNVTQSLTQSDSLWYIQEKTGEECLVIFRDSPDQRNLKKSVFLHTKGYYEHVRDYPDPPDKKQLQTFLIPGRFSKFSYDNYREFIKNNRVFAEDPKLP